MIRPPEGPEPPLPELEALSREQVPPGALEERVVGELRRQSLLRDQRHPWWQMAAAVLLLGAGVVAGRWSVPSTVAPVTTTEPRFLLLLSQAPPDGSESARVAEYRTWAIALRESGRHISGERLGDEAIAINRDGSVERVDDENQGFFIVSAASLDEAVAVARASPHVRAGGRIVVRPVE